MNQGPEMALFGPDPALIQPKQAVQRARCVTCDRSGPRGATRWQCARCKAGNVSTYWKTTKRCETCNNPAATGVPQCGKCIRDGVAATTEES